MLGAIVVVGYVIVITVVAGSATNKATNAIALPQVEQANNVLGEDVANFQSAVGACNGQLTCVTALDRKLAGSLQTFATALRSVNMSGSASSDVNSVVSDTNAAAQDLSQLGAATTVAQYQSLASSRRSPARSRQPHRRLRQTGKGPRRQLIRCRPWQTGHNSNSDAPGAIPGDRTGHKARTVRPVNRRAI